jgi:hypothetical protein
MVSLLCIQLNGYQMHCYKKDIYTLVTRRIQTHSQVFFVICPIFYNIQIAVSQLFFVLCPIFDNIQIPVSQLFFVLCPIFNNIQIPVSNLKKTNIEYMGSFDVMQVNIKPNLRNKRVGLERL